MNIHRRRQLERNAVLEAERAARLEKDKVEVVEEGKPILNEEAVDPVIEPPKKNRLFRGRKKKDK